MTNQPHELRMRGASSVPTSDATQHIIRDMILLALDALEQPETPEANRLEARAALAEALDVVEGGAA